MGISIEFLGAERHLQMRHLSAIAVSSGENRAFMKGARVVSLSTYPSYRDMLIFGLHLT